MEDISLNVGSYLLNFRVSAIFMNKNKILLHHGLKKDHYTLPGGRVKEGESTIEALFREIKEETGLDVEYVKPCSFIENFFTMNNKKYHELLVTHELTFLDKTVYQKEKIMPLEEEKQGNLEFEWIEIEKLDKIKFFPQTLIKVIKSENKNFSHIINDERKNTNDKHKC